MIQDNTTKWKVRKFTDFASNQALPLGFMYQHLSPIVPVGSLPLLGGTYDRSLYADLWSWANENGLVVTESEWQAMATAQGGSCSKFSDGNGSTTFRVPALKCWVKGASGIEEVGSYLQAGLPNITGSFKTGQGGIVEATGAFANGEIYGTYGGSISTTGYFADFNTSRSNPIYGNADTVQPPSIVGMWCIVAYGTVTNVGNTDVANVMQAVEQVQTELNEIQQLFKPYVPDYSAEIFTDPFSKDINSSIWFEAPCAGVLYVQWCINPSGNIVRYCINNYPMRLLGFSGASQTNGFSTFILDKNDRIKFYLSGNEKADEQNAYFYPFKEATV